MGYAMTKRRDETFSSGTQGATRCRRSDTRAYISGTELWGCSLLVRRQPGLSEVMLEVFDTSKGHNALALCGAPTEGFLGFVGRVQVWIEGDLSRLLDPWKRVGFVLSVRGEVHVYRACRLRSQWCLGGGW